MIRVILLLVLFLFKSIFSFAQDLESNIRWVKVLTGMGLGSVEVLSATDNAGNLVILTSLEGEFKIDHNHISNTPPNSFTSILKFNSSGSLIFYKHLDNSRNPFGLAIDGSNNIYISYSSFLTPQTKILLKLNSGGNILWKDSLQHRMLTSLYYFNELAVDSIGNLFVGSVNEAAGSVYFNADSLFRDTTGMTFFMLKINSNGGLVKSRFFTDADNQWGFSNCYMKGIAYNGFNSLLTIIGYTTFGNLEVGSLPGDTMGQGSFILTYNSNFDIISKSEFPGTDTYEHSINFDKHNNIYVSFNTSNREIIDGDTLEDNGGTAGVIIKLNSVLNHSWHQYIENDFHSVGIMTSSVNSSGNIYFTIQDQDHDSLASKISTDGNFRWNFFLPGAPINSARRIINCGLGSQLYGTIGVSAPVIINGNTYVPDSFSVLLYNMNDPDSLVGIDELEIPDITIYPNPLIDVLNISSTIRIKSYCIYNLLGERIAYSEIDGFRYIINIKNYDPGIYFVQIQSDKGSRVLKLIKE